MAQRFAKKRCNRIVSAWLQERVRESSIRRVSAICRTANPGTLEISVKHLVDIWDSCLWDESGYKRRVDIWDLCFRLDLYIEYQGRGLSSGLEVDILNS